MVLWPQHAKINSYDSFDRVYFWHGGQEARPGEFPWLISSSAQQQHAQAFLNQMKASLSYLDQDFNNMTEINC
jgi:hypothetical protein